MQTQVKHRLTMSNADVAARRTASVDDRASWVWVIPLGGGRFRVRAFEVSRDLLVNDDDIYDENMEIVYDDFVDSIAEVDRAVAEAGVDPDELAAPWHSDFPL